MRLNRFFISLFIFLLSLNTFSYSEKVIPIYGKIPDFKFTDQTGTLTGLSELTGSVWVADFIFTRCQGLCRMMTGRMSGLQENLKSPRIKLVSFSVDPEHDTSKVLYDYASQYKAQAGKWFFLTGPKDQIWNLAVNGFSLAVETPTPEDLKAGAEAVIHSSKFVLIDSEGNIRGYYDNSDPQKMEELIQDALSLTAT